MFNFSQLKKEGQTLFYSFLVNLHNVINKGFGGLNITQLFSDFFLLANFYSNGILSGFYAIFFNSSYLSTFSAESKWKQKRCSYSQSIKNHVVRFSILQ